jgi:K+-transporting ATPase KdpF subunit
LPASEENIVNLDYWLGGALTLALTIYLVYALLAPEKF